MASMEKLLELLKDGNARSVKMMAKELDTTTDDIARMLEYMEKMGILRRTELGMVRHEGCSSCSGCATSGGAAACKGCIPKKGFANMGTIWEVVK